MYAGLSRGFTALTATRILLEALSGERKADASALIEYFEPLRAWLADQIKGEKCGW
jgi:hypothetical protein